MTPLKRSGVCAVASAFSYVFAVASGGVCPSEVGSCFIVAFFCFGLASIVFLVISFMRSHLWP